MKIEYSYGMGIAGARIEDCFEVDESELEGKSEEEIETYIDEMVWELVAQNIDWGWRME